MFSWEKFGRKNPRLSGYDYSQSGSYFITIVTRLREEFFGRVVGVDFYVDPFKTENACVALSNVGAMVNEYWKILPNKFPNVRLDEFIVMPNHIHGIIEITDANESLSLGGPTQRSAPTVPNIIQWFKSVTTNAFIRHNTAHHKTFDRRLWQRRYYDHIVRADNDLERIRQYIRDNPKNWFKDRNRPKTKEEV